MSGAREKCRGCALLAGRSLRHKSLFCGDGRAVGKHDALPHRGETFLFGSVQARALCLVGRGPVSGLAKQMGERLPAQATGTWRPPNNLIGMVGAG